LTGRIFFTDVVERLLSELDSGRKLWERGWRDNPLGDKNQDHP
jgi:hypothetical protein